MITKIIWHNDRVLGNLGLNLLKDGNPCNTIVLAGENGTGKTTILENIANFLSGKGAPTFNMLLYNIEDSTYVYASPCCGRFHIYKMLEEDTGASEQLGSDVTKIEIIHDSSNQDLRNFGVAYSSARSGFRTKQVKSSTTLQLDSSKCQIDNNDDYTSLKQLMVDLSEEDNQDWNELTKALLSQRKIVDEEYKSFKKHSRLSRFENAFNAFFETMKFSEIVTKDGEKNVYFKKHDKAIAIDRLSTGEKQIVLRGAYLLRNKNQLSGGTVLVDEPELSMHPKWQEKILKYYRDLFTEGGEQKVQMFFATHSENVLRAALEDRGNVLVVVLKDEGGKITAKPITAPFVLPTITSAELNYEAFDVVSNDYHIALYGYLQSITGNNKVRECDDYIVNHSLYDSSIHEKTISSGRDSYQTLPTYIRNVIDHPTPGRTFTQDELRCSIELLRKLCEDAKTKP